MASRLRVGSTVMKENRKHVTLQLPYTNGHSSAHQETSDIELLELAITALDIVKRYRIYLLFALITGLAAGIVWYQFSDPRYESRLTCQIHGLETPAVNHILSAMKHEYNLPDMSLENNLSGNGMFVIKVIVTDPEHLPALQQHLVDYIGRNEFVKKAVEIEQSRMTDLIRTLEVEENRVADVTKQTISGGNLHGEIYSVADLSKLKMDFYKERLQLEGELERFSAVKIIQGFTTTDDLVNTQLWKYITFPIMAALFLVTMVIAMSELRTAIHNRKLSCQKLD